MDQGAVDTVSGRVGAPEPHLRGGDVEPRRAASAARGRTRRRRRLAIDLTVLSIVGVVLIAAVVAGGAALYRDFYSPTAFVHRYLDMLADRDAAEALAVPGVAVDSAQLDAAGLPPTASDALLRETALGSLTDIAVVSEQTDGDVTHVTVSYVAGSHPGTTTFDVVRDGSIGLAPTWRFATSPLALIDLRVQGSMVFEVNGFEIDKRQVSPDGVDADPMAPVRLLAFSPGIYSVSVDTAISATPGVAVLSDSPLTSVPVEVVAEPTAGFVSVVQERVEEFLTACATQQVLQPTACPFGITIEDRVASPPEWSIVQQPLISVEADGANWRIPAVEAVAHLDVDIRSLFDGSVRQAAEDVPFVMTGTITVQPDGSASIVIEGSGALDGAGG